MNPNHEVWAEWEDEFLRQVYPLPEWSANDIAEKLERSRAAVMKRAAILKVKRPRDRLDYKAIRSLKSQGKSSEQIGRALNCCPRAVRYALKKMAEGVENAQ